MEKFVYTVLGINISLLVLTAVMCYNVDPANIFGHNKFMEQAGTIVAQGNIVAINANHDERLLQKKIIELTDENYDVLIFGSSRSMLLKESLFSNESVHNYSVSGSGLQDDLALLTLYIESRHQYPKKVVLGLDPWVLNENSGDTRWQSLSDSYLKGMQQLGLEPEKIGQMKQDKYKQLISFPYIKASLSALKNHPRTVRQVASEDEMSDTEGGMNPDGSHIEQRCIANRTDVEVEKDAQSYVSDSIVYQMEKYNELSNKRILLLTKLVDNLKVNGVEVIFYLPPYHPYVYEQLFANPQYNTFLKAETYIRSMAKDNGITVYGAYNPKELGVDNSDFTDGMHLRYDRASKVFKVI